MAKNTKSPQLKHALFLTDPHGAQAVRFTEKRDDREKIGDQLFTLFAAHDDLDRVTMTGEELDSLCKQWILFRNANWPEEVTEWLRSEGEEVRIIEDTDLESLPDVLEAK